MGGNISNVSRNITVTVSMITWDYDIKVINVMTTKMDDFIIANETEENFYKIAKKIKEETNISFEYDTKTHQITSDIKVISRPKKVKYIKNKVSILD